MPRVHRNYREGRNSRFTHESKFLDTINTHVLAKEAIQEGDALRKMLSGRRILIDRTGRDLMNAFRL